MVRWRKEITASEVVVEQGNEEIPSPPTPCSLATGLNPDTRLYEQLTASKPPGGGAHRRPGAGDARSRRFTGIRAGAPASPTEEHSWHAWRIYAGDGRPVRAGGVLDAPVSVDFWRRTLRFPSATRSCSARDDSPGRPRRGRSTASPSGSFTAGSRRTMSLALQAPNSATLMLLRLAAEEAGVISLLVPPTFSRAEVGAIADRLPLAGAVFEYRARAQLAGSTEPGRRPRSGCSRSAIAAAGAIDVESWLARSCAPGEPARSRRTSLSALRVRGDHHDERHDGRASLRRAHGLCALGVRARLHRPAAARLRRRRRRDGVSLRELRSRRAPHGAPQVGAKSCSSIASIRDPSSPAARRVTCAVFVPTLRPARLRRACGGYLSSLRIVTSFGAILAPEIAAEVEQVNSA